MKLAYRAYEKTGREVTDVIDAANAADATERLRQKDLFVADIRPAVQARPAEAQPGGFRLPKGAGARLKNLALFTRQLHVLIRAGTPLAEGLMALERQAKDPTWSRVVRDVRRRLEQGCSLSQAMDARPRHFDQVYRNMVNAGEKSGKLTTVLERLSQLIRKRLHVRRTVRAAMIYPTLLVCISLAVFVVMLVVVVPRFADLFKSLDVPLPATTAFLISVSEILRAYWYGLVGVVVALVAGLWYLPKTEPGRRAIDTLLLRLPYFGGMVRSFATAQIARLLGVLLDSHLPILEALDLTKRAVRNVHYQHLLTRAEEAVSRGRPISSAFRDTDLISPSVYEATRSGEASGQVSPLLLDLADFLDEENEASLRGLISLLEPAILIAMGLVVGLVALSIFTPLFDATGAVRGGN